MPGMRAHLHSLTRSKPRKRINYNWGFKVSCFYDQLCLDDSKSAIILGFFVEENTVILYYRFYAHIFFIMII